jgi:hypothetical protein
LIAPGKDWRDSELGQEIIAYVLPEPVQVDFDFPQSDQPLIGVIDTGFSGDNPDIDYSRIILGSDRVDGDDNPLLPPSQVNQSATDNSVPTVDGDDNPLLPSPQVNDSAINDLVQPTQASEHGTHVLGIIGATQDNGIGVDGINDDAPLWVGRAVGSGQWAESLVEFFDKAVESNQPNAIVNLSLDLTQINPDRMGCGNRCWTAQHGSSSKSSRNNNSSGLRSASHSCSGNVEW